MSLRRSGIGASLVRLLAAWLLACAGGWAFAVAVAVYAFEKSGAGGVAAVTVARLIPATVAAPLMSSLLDRKSRGRVVAGACLVQAACLGAVAALLLGNGALGPIVGFTAVVGAAATAVRPGCESLMPALAVSPDELTRSTAAWGAIDNGGFLLGGGAGGALIALTSPGTVTAIAAGSLAVAGLLALGLPAVLATAPDEPDAEPEGLTAVLGGLRAIAQTPILRAPFCVLAALLLIEGTTDVQVVVLALGKLKLGNGGPGLLFAIWGVGGLLGSAMLLRVVRRRGYGLALSAGAAAFAVGLMAAGVDGVPAALLGMIPAGLGFALVELGFLALIPRLADDAVVGRVYGLSELLYSGAAAAGALIAPGLIAAFGQGGSLVFVGAAFGAGTAVAYSRFGRIDAEQQEADGVRDLLHGVAFLTPLPLPRLERLVQGARKMIVPAGDTIIRKGDPGDDFFVVADGTVGILEHDASQGRGTAFGEIALLRSIPRTATVRALTEVHLWVLGRKSFFAAVTSHDEASRLADITIDRHLEAPSVGPGGSESSGKIPG